MKHKLILLAVALMSAVAAFAQTQVKGVVVDANGPVIGAAVLQPLQPAGLLGPVQLIRK